MTCVYEFRTEVFQVPVFPTVSVFRAEATEISGFRSNSSAQVPLFQECFLETQITNINVQPIEVINYQHTTIMGKLSKFTNPPNQIKAILAVGPPPRETAFKVRSAEFV